MILPEQYLRMEQTVIYSVDLFDVYLISTRYETVSKLSTFDSGALLRSLDWNRLRVLIAKETFLVGMREIHECSLPFSPAGTT